MAQKEKIEKIIEMCRPCIVVTPRFNYDRGRKCARGLTVLGESSDQLGHSHGVGCYYDYGFMQLDTENGISVIVLN